MTQSEQIKQLQHDLEDARTFLKLIAHRLKRYNLAPKVAEQIEKYLAKG